MSWGALSDESGPLLQRHEWVKQKGPVERTDGAFLLAVGFRRSAGPNVRRLLAFSPGRRGELDRLTILERLESLSGDLRMMNEQVLTTIIGSDEAETLFLVEPLYRTSCHVIFSLDLGASTVQVPSTVHQGMLRGRKVYTLTQVGMIPARHGLVNGIPAARRKVATNHPHPLCSFCHPAIRRFRQPTVRARECRIDMPMVRCRPIRPWL